MKTMEGSERKAFTLIWMHGVLVLTGIGTVLLGPVLPFLARRWHLDDGETGILLLAQFVGAFLGGVTVSSRPRRETITGMFTAIFGLIGFTEASGIRFACIEIAVAGFGIGRLITSVNLLAAWKFPEDRRSVLTRLSFSWGVGAMLSPVLSTFLTPRYSLGSIGIGFGALFSLLLGTLLVQAIQLPVHAPLLPTTAQGSFGLRPAILTFFATTFALYGGLESSLSGWMSTFALRFGGFRIGTSGYTSFLLLAGLTAGRLFATYLPARRTDRQVVRVALMSTSLCICLLAFAHTPSLLSVFATLLGFSLAAVFPTLFSLLMAQRPLPRQAGFANALAGLGAAILPWLVGLVSQRTGSLKVALLIPLVSALVLLCMTFKRE